MKKRFDVVFAVIFTGILLVASVCFAQEQEAGKYERKSISYINALWLLDPTTRALKPGQVQYILEKIKQKISMARFDYNPLPESMLKSFVERANSKSKLTIDDVAKLMEKELVPQIMKILEAKREMRAADLRTEQQKNSFISDKAKELDITGDQFEKVMNSAYLYLPVISNFLLIKSGKQGSKSWKASARMGILWYSLTTKGENPKINLLVKKMSLTFGLARIKKKTSLTGRRYLIDGESVLPREYAFRSMVRSGVKNLVVATQQIPEFNLSGQIVEASAMSAGFDIGKNEGLKIDDKYLIMEQTEGSDGTVKEDRTGWIIVSHVADTNSAEGYKSKGKIISGPAELGNVLREYPRLSLDISLGVKSFPYSGLFGYDSVSGGGTGLDISVLYNIGRFIRINQLFLGFSFGLGAGNSDDSNTFSSVSSVSNMNMEGLLQKKFYIRRLAIIPEVRFGVQSVSVVGSDSVTYINSGAGTSFGADMEFALMPCLNIGAGAVMQSYEDGTWDEGLYGEMDHSGTSMRVYLNWSPPSLPFDPWEMLRGMAGI